MRAGTRVMNKQGILAVVSGFSGAGKGTILNRLIEKYDNYALSISATTRKPRCGETHGKEYFFLTTQQFEDMIDRDELIEHAKYVDNYYGTPREYVTSRLENGQDVILEIDLQGAMNVKKKFPEAVLIFITPPNGEELKKRLISRGTEDMDTIKARLSRAVEEAQGMDRYDYILINDEVEECVDAMHRLIDSQHSRTSNNTRLIEQIRQDVKNNVRGE